MNDVVGEYAKLAVLRESIELSGRRPPAELVRRLSQIETTARARLTPAQFNDAMTHVEHAKLRIYEQQTAAQQAVSEAQSRAFVDRTTRKLTLGVMGQGNGLTREQLTALAAGKRLPTAAPKPTQEQRDAIFRDKTRAMDPAGRGWSEAEYERRMDALAEASPHEFEKLASSVRADPTQLRRAASVWKEERIGCGLQKRREAADRRDGTDKVEPRELNDWERRRVAVADAVISHSADEIERETARGERSETIRELDGAIHDSYLNETDPDDRLTRRAHLSRALEANEGRGDQE